MECAYLTHWTTLRGGGVLTIGDAGAKGGNGWTTLGWDGGRCRRQRV